MKLNIVKLKKLKFMSVKFQKIYPHLTCHIKNISCKKIRYIINIFYSIATLHRYDNIIRNFEISLNLPRMSIGSLY